MENNTTSFLQGLSQPLQVIVGKLNEQKVAYDTQNQIRGYYNKLNEELANLNTQMSGLDASLPEQKTQYDELKVKTERLSGALQELEGNDMTNLIIKADKPFKSRQEMANAMSLLQQGSTTKPQTYKTPKEYSSTVYSKDNLDPSIPIMGKQGTSYKLWFDPNTNSYHYRAFSDLNREKYNYTVANADQKLWGQAIDNAKDRMNQIIAGMQRFSLGVPVNLETLMSENGIQDLINASDKLKGEQKIEFDKLIASRDQFIQEEYQKLQGKFGGKKTTDTKTNTETKSPLGSKDNPKTINSDAEFNNAKKGEWLQDGQGNVFQK